MVHTKIMILLLFYKKIYEFTFHLLHIAAILDLINNAMSKVLYDYITMSDITKTLMLHTKIKNLHLFCQKYDHFILSSCTNGGHLVF